MPKMPNNETDSSIINKKFFTVKNVGVVVLCVFSCASAWGALSHRIEKNEAVNKLQDIDLKEMGIEIDKKVYNNAQLTYRLNSGQTKIINEFKVLLKEHAKMIHDEQKNNVRESAKTDYILAIVKELKQELKK